MIARRLSQSELSQALSTFEVASAVPFRSKAWLLSWSKNFLGRGTDLDCIATYEGDQLTGLAPFFRSQSVANGRVIQFLGGGRACTDYSTIFVREEYETQVCESLTDFLTHEHEEWDKIILDGVMADDSVVKNFCNALSERDSHISAIDGMRCWRLDLPDNWDDMLALLSKSHRKQVRRVQKRLIEQPHFEIIEATNSELVETGLAILIDLHQRRWKSRGQEGCFATSEFRGFISDAAHRLFETNQLQLIWIAHDGVPIAIDFNAVSPDGVFAYQGGVSPDHLHFEPGRAMNIVSLQTAIRNGKNFFDFLRGDEEYKPHWRAEPIATTRYTIIPNRITSRARHGIIQFGRELKTLLTAPR